MAQSNPPPEPTHTTAPPRLPGLALLLLVPAPTLGVLAAMFIWPDTWYGQTLYYLAKSWILVLPLLWLWRIDRTKPRLPRWTWAGVPAGLITGVLTLITIIAAWELIAQYWVDVSLFQKKMADINLDSPAKFLLFAATITIINALLEEYVWRWFVYKKWHALLTRLYTKTGRPIAVPGAIGLPGVIGFPGAGAIGLAALCFTLHHTIAMSLYFNWQTNLLASLGVFLGGVTWSILYIKYKNIYAGYISHIFADIALFYVGYQVAFG